MKTFVLTLALFGSVLGASAQTSTTQAQILTNCSGMSVGTNGALNGFVPSPNDAWHQDVSTAAVDPNNAVYFSNPSDLGNNYLHPDFGGFSYGYIGIPYNVVDSSQTAAVPVAINLYADDSDITIAPVPSAALVEGRPASCAAVSGDQHMLVLDRNKCVLYEYWQAAGCTTTGWSASNTALFDMSLTQARPFGYTSADAAGLSIFEGLIRYDEIVAGSINHAIRFTTKFTKNNANNGYFTAPATHASGTLWGTDNILGMRIRLKANFDISNFSTTNQIILKAMKKYGMILADNGSNMYFQGTSDARWNDDDLDNLKAISATSFEVLKIGTTYDANSAPTGAAPTITSFTAETPTVPAGTPVVLTAAVNNASYSYVDKAGFVRGGVVTVTPSATTTYTLTSRNAFGTTSKSVTVTVAAVVAPALKLALTAIAQTAAFFTASVTSNSPGATRMSIVSGSGFMFGNTVIRTGLGAVVVQVKQAASGKFAEATVESTIAGVTFTPPTRSR